MKSASPTALALAVILASVLWAGAAAPTHSPSVQRSKWTTPGKTVRADVVPGEFLVRFKSRLSALQPLKAVNAAVSSPFVLEPLCRHQDGICRASLAGKDSVAHAWARVRAPAGMSDAECRRRLAADPDVVRVEPNVRVFLTQEPASPPLPNDFELVRQWALHNTGQTQGKEGADIDALEAWLHGTGSSSVVVAVIDSGIDFLHPDLAANMWVNPGEHPGNGVDDDQNGYVDDVNGYDFVSSDGDPFDDVGHGTHVAGIIGAAGNNGIGISGVCWNVSLMAVKVIDEEGSGTMADVLAGIHYAVQNGAKIINASWGTTNRSTALEETLREAYQRGVLICAAAGNERTDKPFYPAAFDFVIAVGASDDEDRLALFSNHGAWVDLLAPGFDILSTVPENRYEANSGTSMAAPHVSGVAALVVAAHPEFTPQAITDVLLSACDSVAETVPPEKLVGAGRLNARRAVEVNRLLPHARLESKDSIEGWASFNGTAAGEDFAGFVVELGTGTAPRTWQAIGGGSTEVQGGVLLDGFDSANLADGLYTFRLQVSNSVGQATSSRFQAEVRNVFIQSPQNNDVLRAGDPVQIQGTVFGPDSTFALEWGSGLQPTQWSTEGMELASGGHGPIVKGSLGTWRPDHLTPNAFYSFRLTATSAGDSAKREHVVSGVYLDSRLRAGWPRYLPTRVQGGHPVEDWRAPVVGDLDGDGLQEIVIVEPGVTEEQPARLVVFDVQGEVKWSRDLASGYPFVDIPVIGDIDGDGKLEVFVDTGPAGLIQGFRSDGTPLGGQWPVRAAGSGWGKIIADLDQDGYPELIALSSEPAEVSQREVRQLAVFDHLGNLRATWNLPYTNADVDVVRLTPAVGNFDDDADLEIVASNGGHELWICDLNASGDPKLRVSFSGRLASSPVVGDIDGDGQEEIVVGAFDPEDDEQGGVYVVKRDGRFADGWPVLTDESFALSPSLADVNGDGRLEIAVASWHTRKLHLLDFTGAELEGWPLGPVTASSLKSGVTFADVNDDGRIDLLMLSPGYWSQVMKAGNLNQVGGVKAWDYSGRQLDLATGADLQVLPIESSGGPSAQKAFPLAFVDLDGNGKVDLVGASIQDAAHFSDSRSARRKNRSSLYVWQLDVPYRPATTAWPVWQATAAHDGRRFKLPIEVEPFGLAEMPGQTIGFGQAFVSLGLDAYVQGREVAGKDVKWSVSGGQQLKASITADHELQVTLGELLFPVDEELVLTAIDARGETATKKLRYQVLPNGAGFTLTNDVLTTAEDASVEISPLANDQAAAGDTLSLCCVGRPAHGTVHVRANGSVIYTPAPDFNGPDSFTYGVRSGGAWSGAAVVNVEVTPTPDPPHPVDDRIQVDEDTEAKLDLLANDFDPDVEPLELREVSAPAHGRVVRLAGGEVSYLPATNYFGSDGFEYEVVDAGGLSARASVRIIVKGVEDNPVAADQDFVINRNGFVSVSLTGQDPDNVTLQYRILDAPKNGVLYNYPTVAVYYPNKGFAGDDTFTYVANDGDRDSSPAVVKVTVLDANNPPDASSMTLLTLTNQAVVIELKAIDLDEDPVAFEIVSQPEHGTLTGSGSNYVFTPMPDFVGTDRFQYLAKDPLTNGAIGVVEMVVTFTNTPPLVEDQAVETKVNQPLSLHVKASDPEGTALTYRLVSGPNQGTLSGGAADYEYRPNSNYTGMDRLLFEVSDGVNTSVPGAVTITVRSANEAPVAADQTVTVRSETPTPIPLDVNDADGEVRRCVILRGPQHGVAYGVGREFTYVSTSGFKGSDQFTYRAWDGEVYGNVATVHLDVIPSRPPPPRPGLRIQPQADGALRLHISAVAGARLVVETSADLIVWTPLAEFIATENETDYVDTEVASAARFYRVYEAVDGTGNVSVRPSVEANRGAPHQE